MPPLGEDSACSSSGRLATRRCGTRAAAQRLARSTPCGVPNSVSKRSAYCRRALLEGGEDRAAVVVDHDDRQVGALLARAEEEPGGVVQEGHVAHQRERARRLRPPQRGADRGADRAVDAGQAAVGDHLAAAADVVAGDDQVEVADRVATPRRTAGRPAAAPRLTAPATSYGVRSGSAASRRVEVARDAAVGVVPRVGPRGVVRSARRRTWSTSRTTGNGRSDQVPAVAHRDHLDVVAGEQARDRPGQGGVAEDHHPLDPVAELAAEQQAVGADDGCRRCGSRWTARRAAATPPSRRARGRAARRRPRRPRRCAARGRGRAARGLRRRPGTAQSGRLSPVPAAVVGQQRVVELDVEVDGPAVAVAAHEGEQLVEVGRGDVEGRGEGPEDADLVGGLVGPGAPQPGRPVGGDHDERHAGVGRLDHGGSRLATAVPDVQATAAGRPPTFARPSARKRGGALVDPGVQPERRRPGRRRRARTTGARCATRARARPRARRRRGVP